MRPAVKRVSATNYEIRRYTHVPRYRQHELYLPAFVVGTLPVMDTRSLIVDTSPLYCVVVHPTQNREVVAHVLPGSSFGAGRRPPAGRWVLQFTLLAVELSIPLK